MARRQLAVCYLVRRKWDLKVDKNYYDILQDMGVDKEAATSMHVWLKKAISAHERCKTGTEICKTHILAQSILTKK